MRITPELPHNNEADSDPRKAINQLAQLALHDVAFQERLERGDQLGGDSNRGFRVEYLDQPIEHEAAPIDEVLPKMPQRFAKEYVAGTLLTEAAENVEREVDSGGTGFAVTFPVAASKYNQAVAKGEVPAGLFDTDGKVAQVTPGAEVLEELVDTASKEQSVEANYNKWAFGINRQYIDDLEGITDTHGYDARNELEQVSQAYDFMDAGKTIRLINLSNTKLSKEQISQAANALRSISDKSAGELFERLDNLSLKTIYTIA
jgi:hypothetical protein